MEKINDFLKELKNNNNKEIVDIINNIDLNLNITLFFI